jgi:hypothetical protein
MPTRDEPHRRPTLEHELVLFHYEHAVQHSDPPAAIATIEKQSFGHAGIALVLLACVRRKRLALYRTRRSSVGYQFRRLHPELEGEALAAAVHGASSDDIPGLIRLGLSYGEIGSLTGRSRQDIQKASRRA